MIHRQTIHDFARFLGIAAVDPDERGLAVFAFERLGELHLQCLEDDLLVTLVRAVEGGAGAAERVLRACRADERTPFVVNPGWTCDGRAALSVRLSGDQLEADVVDAALDVLDGVFDLVAETPNTI